METLISLSCCIVRVDYSNLVSITLSVISLIVAFGFYLRPSLRCNTKIDNGEIKVKLENHNWFRKKILNIKCEVAVAEDLTFDNLVETTELLKDYTLMLHKKTKNNKKNYVFVCQEPFKSNNTELKSNKYNITCNYMRIRFLVPNFLGVNKGYEVIYEIKSVEILTWQLAYPKHYMKEIK
jgi:hypothetical protein